MPKTRKITVTKKERKFIKDLQKLLSKAPETLQLFGWSGTLVVLKDDKTGFPCVVEDYFAMKCDGGDPTDNEVCQHVEIDYE